MKRFGVFWGILALFLLAACSSSKDVTEYVDVSFSGIDSIGKAHYSIDEEKLYSDIFDFDPELNFPDDKTITEISTIASAYKVKLDHDQNLSNGDTVTLTISVDKEKTKKIKGGEIEFTVEGLEDAKDITPYVDVSFSGLDSQGTAEYDIDEDQLLNDLFGYDIDDNAEAQINDLKAAYSIELDKDKNLSNGDKVTVTISVDQDKSGIIKSGKKEFTVHDLGEATKLTTKDVEKHLVLNFNGVSGKGSAQIDNTFGSDLGYFNFKIENDGALKNGDQAKLVWDEEIEEQLNSYGYIVDEDFDPTFEVEDLAVVAEIATDIENLDDIKRMIEEEVNRLYQDMSPEYSFGRKYKIQLETMMYRQFSEEDGDGWYQDEANSHGNLIGIYSIEKYSGGDSSALEDEFTAIVGYYDIHIDEDNKANVAKIERFNDKKDSTYSLKSVIQLYEGNGYTKIKE